MLYVVKARNDVFKNDGELSRFFIVNTVHEASQTHMTNLKHALALGQNSVHMCVCVHAATISDDTHIMWK